MIKVTLQDTVANPYNTVTAVGFDRGSVKKAYAKAQAALEAAIRKDENHNGVPVLLVEVIEINGKEYARFSSWTPFEHYRPAKARQGVYNHCFPLRRHAA